MGSSQMSVTVIRGKAKVVQAGARAVLLSSSTHTDRVIPGLSAPRTIPLSDVMYNLSGKDLWGLCICGHAGVERVG